ncbi:MAG TPA: hypothetical protein VML91_28985 [Burkholderiales bacterium]|nr:hypothetical protein [Burkholderiales bacterium]
MNPEMQQAMIARARRTRSEAVAALVVAAVRGLGAQVLKLRRAWVAGERTRGELHRLSDRRCAHIRVKRAQIDSLHRQLRSQTKA